MTGAIVPDDWDGSSYQCLKVIWPSSEQWTAILLGQITEPAKTAYWMGLETEKEEAAKATENAYLQTIANDGYIAECEDIMIPSAFKFNKSDGLSIDASFWQSVSFNSAVYEINEPGWDDGFFTPGHRPADVGKAGLWHYELAFSALTPSLMFLRCVIEETGEQIALTRGSGNFATLSFEYFWDGGEDKLIPEIWTLEASTLDTQPKNCYFSGFYLGEGV